MLIRSSLKTIYSLTMLICSLGLFAQVDSVAVDAFVSRFSEKYKISKEEIIGILRQAEFQPSIIKKASKPAEGTMSWQRYRNLFVTPERTQAGVEFWKKHKTTFQTVSKETGVPEEIILGIIGVETYFGRTMGSYKVLDALYTLGFGFPKRSKFFQSELEKFLVLAEQEKLEVNAVMGSYAGAMGYGQFMPSSYMAYAKSFEKHGTRDLLKSPQDAIASVANYLKVHRWKKGQPITAKATMTREIRGLKKQSIKPKNKVSDYTVIGFRPEKPLHDELPATMVVLKSGKEKEHWFGLHNFYVITRYNHSSMYAMAVYQLAEAIKKKMKRSDH